MTLLEKLRIDGPDRALQLAAADVIDKLIAALKDSYEDQLYDALGHGVINGKGKWWPGGLSTAEWFCRCADIDYDPEFTREELAARVPQIATTIVERVTT